MLTNKHALPYLPKHFAIYQCFYLTGSFKEETIGVDCVVRGKYGYVDPDGVKREYEYQSGNPCDPNKRGQPEEDEDEELVVRGRPNTLEGQQRLGGLLNARPVQLQQQQLQYRQRQQ